MIRPAIRRIAAASMVGAAALALSACQEEAAPPPAIRPVLSTVVMPRATTVVGFTGTVEPRYKVSLGFRILGRLIARGVEVGDQVAAGQRLAAIDPVSLDLAVKSAEADVFTARAQLANATGVEERQRTLLGQSTATQAQFEAAQQAREAAAATLKRGEANLVKAREQLGYAVLHSDIDGLVTAISAQVGQVVSPGQAVVTVARPDIREAALDVPEDVARELKPGAAFDVALQLDPTIHTSGRLREVAPQADPTTRTRRLLVTLSEAQSVFRLGTTVTASVATSRAETIDLPASALLERDGRAFVWVVDPKSSTVATQPVTLAERSASGFRVAEGLAPGARVVTAGVHSLQPGQSVKILGESAR